MEYIFVAILIGGLILGFIYFEHEFKKSKRTDVDLQKDLFLTVEEELISLLEKETPAIGGVFDIIDSYYDKYNVRYIPRTVSEAKRSIDHKRKMKDLCQREEKQINNILLHSSSGHNISNFAENMTAAERILWSYRRLIPQGAKSSNSMLYIHLWELERCIVYDRLKNKGFSYIPMHMSDTPRAFSTTNETN